MILINDKWWQAESLEDIRLIVTEEFNEELAAKIGQFHQLHTDEDYYSLECAYDDKEAEIESLEDDIEYLERRNEELEDKIEKLTNRDKLISVIYNYFMANDRECFSENESAELADVILTEMRI